MSTSTYEHYEGCVLCGLIDTAISSGIFKIWTKLIKKSEWFRLLDNGGFFTLFIPTDTAFSRVSPEYLQSLESNPEELNDFIDHFIVPEFASTKVHNSHYSSVAGDDLLIESNLSGPSVNQVSIKIENIIATNGMIHAVDSIDIFNMKKN